MLQMFHHAGGPPGPVKNDIEDMTYLERLGTTNYSDDGKEQTEEELSDDDEPKV